MAWRRWTGCAAFAALTTMMWVGVAVAGEGKPKGAASAAADDVPPPAQSSALTAQGTTECVQAFDNAQQQRLAGRPLAARTELVRCAQDSCPDVINSKCVQWLQEVRGIVPSLVVAVRDKKGRDVVDAQLFIDGRRVALKMAGVAIELEPGPHQIEARGPHGTVRQDVLLREGEQRRRVEMLLIGKASPKPEKVDDVVLVPIEEPALLDDLPLLSWVGFTSALVGIAIGTSTGVAAMVLGDELEQRCQQNECHPPEKERLAAATAVAHTSTVSFALSGAFVGLGIVGLLVDSDEPKDAIDNAQLELRIAPGRLTLMGTF